MGLAEFSFFHASGVRFYIIDFVNFNRKMNSLVLSKCNLVVKILSNIGVMEKVVTVYRGKMVSLTLHGHVSTASVPEHPGRSLRPLHFTDEGI